MPEEQPCAVCQKPAQHKCGGCHAVFYCSKEHQKTGWKTHKKRCKAFKICEDEVLGRHLVATRPIKQGEILLKEPPLIRGPSQNTTAVCLGCNKQLTQETAKPCSQCGWPMCCQICQNSPHHIPECSYTMKRGDKVAISTFGVPHPSYQSIIILRCLYQKQFLPEVWDKIAKLQSHCEERKASGKEDSDRQTVVQLIKKFFKLDTFPDEDILKACGIVMVNGHEVPLTNPPHIAIYETTSMFEHSCKANCSKSFTADGSVLITAGTNIEKGEHLSICYTDPLWGTSNRRHHLYESKYFWCKCQRCSDPCELGTNFNSMRCTNNNCKGYLLSNSFLEEDNKIIWQCNVCQSEKKNQEICENLDRIGIDLSQLPKGNSSACKMFLNKYEKLLHPNHYYLVDVKFALTQLLGQEFHGGLPNVSDEDLQLKAKYCIAINDLAKKIAPAERRIRGLLLFELHATIAEIGRRRTTSGEASPQDLHLSLIESKQYLAEAVELLKFEPEELPEGKICQQARLNLQDIDVLLRTMHTTFGDAP